MLKILQIISQNINTASHVEDALVMVVKQVCDILPADACSLFLCDDSQGEYVLMAAEGLQFKSGRSFRLRFGVGLIGFVAQRGELLNIADASSHIHYQPHPTSIDHHYHAFLGVPLVDQGELLGVLTVQRYERRVFSEEEAALCTTLAVHVAIAAADARARGMLNISGKRKKTGDGRRPCRRKQGGSDAILTGIVGAQGIVIGKAVVISPSVDLESVSDQVATDFDKEIGHFKKALAGVRDDISSLHERARDVLDVSENTLFEAYLHLLDSRTFINEVMAEIRQGQWAQAALRTVIKQHISHFESLEDPYLRERATDFRDLGRRILSHLESTKKEAVVYPDKVLLISEEVTATALMEVPTDRLCGVISGSGSSNSHVAILARALGLPALMGVHRVHLAHLEGKELILDGYNGHLYVSPSLAIKKAFKALAEEEKQLNRSFESLHDLPATTKDNKSIALYVNTGLALEGGFSLSVGADGVGLYRTEMPFMIRERFPSEKEQRIMYRQLLQTFAPKPVVMRTLDIGGDKQLPYFSVQEENPFLGWRGIRVSLAHPEIFLQQVRAMLQASVGLGNLSLLLPMISSVQEVELAKRFIKQAHQELLEESFDVKWPDIGVMIEVPAAVYQAHELAKRVNFLSVGSNDLIQYLLAVDRNNPRVANLYEGLHPAVLRALQHVVKAARKTGRSISLCGEMAGDPMAVILLLAMGFNSLSMNARILPRIKWMIRHFTMEDAKQLLTEVLKMDDAKEIRLHMETALDQAGLGGLIRAGN